MRTVMLGLALVLGLVAPARALVIDSFEDDIPFLTTGINLDAGGYLASRRAGVLGGSIAGGLDALEGLAVIDFVGGVAAEMIWPDTGGTPDVDLTQGAADRFQLDIGPIAGTWQATIAVDDGAVSDSVVILGVTAAGTLEFLFSDFAGVDFTTVDQIRLLLTNLGGPLDGITALELRTSPIPEPLTASMFMLGLLGLGFGARKA